LIIDAMDILYSKHVDGFCIVSSDSDFTRLASRLREAGMYVVGMGEKKTPAPFIAACEKFKYLEVLAEIPESTNGTTERKAEGVKELQKDSMANIREITKFIQKIINDISNEDGWAHLGEVGNRLAKRYPDFDARNYGHSKLSQLIASLNQFELQRQKPDLNYIMVRNKPVVKPAAKHAVKPSARTAKKIKGV